MNYKIAAVLAVLLSVLLTAGCAASPPPAPTVTTTPATTTVTVTAPAPTSAIALPPVDPHDLFRSDTSACRSDLTFFSTHIDDYTMCVRSIVSEIQRRNRGGIMIHTARTPDVQDYKVSSCAADLTRLDDDQLAKCFDWAQNWLIQQSSFTKDIDSSTAIPVGMPACQSNLRWYATHINTYEDCLSDIVDEIQVREGSGNRVPTQPDGQGIEPSMYSTSLCEPNVQEMAIDNLGECFSWTQSWLATIGTF
jgi:hypothetical protein